MWASLASHLPWEQEIRGSNPLTQNKTDSESSHTDYGLREQQYGSLGLRALLQIFMVIDGWLAYFRPTIPQVFGGISFVPTCLHIKWLKQVKETNGKIP